MVLRYYKNDSDELCVGKNPMRHPDMKVGEIDLSDAGGHQAVVSKHIDQVPSRLRTCRCCRALHPIMILSAVHLRVTREQKHVFILCVHSDPLLVVCMNTRKCIGTESCPLESMPVPGLVLLSKPQLTSTFVI